MLIKQMNQAVWFSRWQIGNKCKNWSQADNIDSKETPQYNINIFRSNALAQALIFTIHWTFLVNENPFIPDSIW